MSRFSRMLTLSVAAVAVAALLFLGGTPDRAAAKPPGGGGGGGGGTPPVTYSITLLGTLEPGGTGFSWATGMNNFGDVVGGSSTLGTSGSAPFLWTAETGMVDQHSLVDPALLWDRDDPNDVDGWIFQTGMHSGAVNDLGQITGHGYQIQNGVLGTVRAYRLDPPWMTGELFYYTIVDLGNLGGNNGTISTAINYTGDVTGYSVASDGQYHMFLWADNAGIMQDLGAWNGSATFAFGLTERDTNGVIRIAGHGGGRALRYKIGIGYEDLGTLKSDDSGSAGAAAINTRGDVAGWAAADPKKGNENERAFLFVDGLGMTSLGTLSTGRTWNDSEAFSLNDRLEVVGRSLTTHPNSRAFYYSPATGMLDLETLITDLPPSMQGTIRPAQINNNGNNGQICGPRVDNFYGYDGVAFILTPIVP